MKKLLEYLGETHGARASTSARVYCNKLVYPLARLLAKAPPRSWVHSRWHWYRFPFSLRDQVLWSQPLRAWFCPADESALECMLHMPTYEPVDWVAPGSGDVFIDVGAHIGWYSIRAARACGAHGRVVAFEPDVESRAQLEKNALLNGIHNVTVVSKAAWSQTGSIGWQRDERPEWRKVDKRSGEERVETVRVDEVVDSMGLSRVDWIKLDVEGAELDVLEGAEGTLRQFHPPLYIEVHDTLRELRGFLEPLRYSIERASFDLPPDRHGWILTRVP